MKMLCLTSDEVLLFCKLVFNLILNQQSTANILSAI